MVHFVSWLVIYSSYAVGEASVGAFFSRQQAADGIQLTLLRHVISSQLGVHLLI